MNNNGRDKYEDIQIDQLTSTQVPESRRGFRRRRGAVDVFLQGFDPLPTQRVPFSTFLRYSFLVTDPKIFLKAPWAPIHTNFEGERALFLLFFSKYVLVLRGERTPFSACFFQNLCGAEIMAKTGSL